MMIPLKRYEGLYWINESGVIVNHKGHPMRTAISNAGYLRVALEDPSLNNSKLRKNESIHRLVAETFIPNPNNLPIVMHKDNDKLNNHYTNLKWGTQEDNMQQAIDDGLIDDKPKFINIYEVYNDNECIKCRGRDKVAELIQYKEISLKNMIGKNPREISLGPYKGYKIRRTGEKIKIIKPVNFNNQFL